MKGRPVPPRPNPYPGYPCIHSVYEVHQYGEDQLFEAGTAGPLTPYLLLESTPCDGADCDPMELMIPYDQLDDVIRVLMEARTLQPPKAVWQQTPDGWRLLEEAHTGGAI
jgi:hypothetical protein